MTWKPLSQLVLMWWNTSLSPPTGRAKEIHADREFAINFVRELRTDYRFDVLGLCEVSSDDLEAIVQGLDDPYLDVIDSTDRQAQLKLDTAIIYDRRKLEKIDFSHCIDRYGNTCLKAGTVVRFFELSSGLQLHVVTSHWPGRQFAPEFSAKRAKLGAFLCQETRSLKQRAPNPYIVLMGDYNDDPFSESLASHLLATRDRELARSNGDYFYNPFWRCIGESLPSPETGCESSICGTHFYRGGTESRWFTFDQIMFSSPFLQSDGAAILDERHSGIVVTPDLRERVLSRKSAFDHFPVLSMVTIGVNHE